MYVPADCRLLFIALLTASASVKRPRLVSAKLHADQKASINRFDVYMYLPVHYYNFFVLRTFDVCNLVVACIVSTVV